MLTLSRLSLATLLLAVPLVAAQDGTQEPSPAQTGQVEGGGAPSPENIPKAEDKPGDETAEGYPKWVTNDYPCVIGCLQGFNGADTSRERNTELEKSSRQCVLDTCNKDSEAMNMYQMTYIVEMFYATGSIYECDGKWCLPEGETAAPVPADQAEATSSSGSDSASGTGSDGHSATPAVSIPGVNKGESDTGASTVVETATASGADTGAIGSESSTPAAEESGNGAKATNGERGIGLVLGAVGVVLGAGVVL